MKKRFLGLDIGSSCSYLTLLEYEKNELKNIRFFSSQCEELSDQLAELYGNVGGHLGIGDRIAAALPAKSAYVRMLELPFRDTKKIAAAVPFSLSSQIPVSVEDCLTSAIINSKTTDGLSKVTAAAIPKKTVDQVLSAAQIAEIPLHILDLPPFSQVHLVAESTKNALLIAVNPQETIISHIQSGELNGYQLIPKKIQPKDNGDIQSLSRAIQALTTSDKDEALPVFIVGDCDIEMLAKSLNEMGYDAKELSLRLAGETVPPAYFHATALAYRAAGTDDLKSFNFRSGEYALKGEWQKLKRALWIAAGLTMISLVIVAAAAIIQYRSKATQANMLQGEMTQLFRQTFPATTTIVDIPLQMTSSIRELRENITFIGGSQPQVLSILKLLSESTDNLQLEVEELSIGSGEVKVNGNAPSFDAINKATEQLGNSPLVEQVQVADAQMALKGDKINFRLILDLVPN
ncbi:MAG: type II secretion system protein GspL [Desulfuromusa sp.]|jgi:general secretion pathway protein L|nr:type II secretion system protein GspL [Desulfuromusa sp.]